MSTHHPQWRAATRAFLPMLWEHRRTVVVSYVYRAATIGLSLMAPWPLKIIIDRVVSHHPLPSFLRGLDQGLSPKGLVLVMAGVIVLIAWLRALTEARMAIVTARLRERLNTDLRDRMLAHLQTLPPTIRSVHRSGELVLRLVNDVDLFVRFEIRTLPMILEQI